MQGVAQLPVEVSPVAVGTTVNTEAGEMAPSVRDEIERLTEIVVGAARCDIVLATLRVDPADASAVWKLLREFHPYARGWPIKQEEQRSGVQADPDSHERYQVDGADGSDSLLKSADAWGAEELAPITHRMVGSATRTNSSARWIRPFVSATRKAPWIPKAFQVTRTDSGRLSGSGAGSPAGSRTCRVP